MPNIKVHNQMTPDECGYYGKITNPENLTDADKEVLERYLTGSSHIQKLYICRNGHISSIRFQYKGGFKELKGKEGKFYARLKTKKKHVLDEYTRTMRWIDLHIPYDEFEIINEYINK